jgi:hypothetical protein
MRPALLVSLFLAFVANACLKAPATRVSGSNPANAPVSPAQAAAGLKGKKDLMLFLLIGQSNMVGEPKPAPEDEAEDPRVFVLAYDDCPNLGRTYDHWYPAKPPLHLCDGGVGPGDSFGKALAAAYPAATIGLVPVAIPGVDVDFFVKGAVSKRRHEFRIPPDDHWTGAYEWVIERARLAQQVGQIHGIIFHQGESDTGSSFWVKKVKRMVRDLRSDLGLGEAPFVAGELLYTGCCGQVHNPLLPQLRSIPNSRVVSAQGLTGMDVAHFDLPSQREFGKRYARAMVELMKAK